MTREIYRGPLKALCADGKVRMVYVSRYCYDGSFAADTFFSVPAHVKANGKTVAGYVTGIEDEPRYAFHAYLYRKNHAAIVPVSAS